MPHTLLEFREPLDFDEQRRRHRSAIETSIVVAPGNSRGRRFSMNAEYSRLAMVDAEGV